MNSSTKKLLLGAVLIVALGGFVYWSSSQSTAAAPVADNTAPTPTDAAATTTPAPSPTPAAPAASGAYKDGTYTGMVANSIYGNVQVSATIAGGEISDVTFLQAPNSQPHSVDVSAMAEPLLKQEAIASQNSNVSIVTGATQTSQAFQQTLQSALDQAQA